jgi:hypothetical protein
VFVWWWWWGKYPPVVFVSIYDIEVGLLWKAIITPPRLISDAADMFTLLALCPTILRVPPPVIVTTQDSPSRD